MMEPKIDLNEDGERIELVGLLRAMTTSETIEQNGYSFQSSPRTITSKKKLLVRDLPSSLKHYDEFGVKYSKKDVKKKKEYIVATKGEENERKNSAKSVEEIPLSVLTKHRGPHRDEDGKLIFYSILGDAEEFLQQKKEIIGEDEEDRAVELKMRAKKRLEREKWLKKVEKLRRREQKENQKKIRSMQIFEQTQYLKQEKALENWYNTQYQWNYLKSSLAAKTKRAEDALVIASTEGYRTKVEEMEVMEREFNRNREGYVDPLWRPYEPVGSVLSGLWVKRKDASTEPVEVIRNPSRPFSRTTARLSSDTLSYKNSLTASLPNPQVDGLQVIGVGISVNSMYSLDSAYGPRVIAPRSPDEFSYTDSEQELDDVQSEDEGGVGPSLRFSTNKLFFHYQLPKEDEEEGTENSSSTEEERTHILRIENTGSTSIYYSWTKTDSNPQFTKKDGLRRFYFKDTPGVLLPRDSIEITITFKTPTHGIYFETWKFETNPSLPASQNPYIDLKGIAVVEENLSQLRKQLDAQLTKNEIYRSVQSIVNDVIMNLNIALPPSEEESPEFIQRQQFIVMNAELAIEYTPELLTSLQQLYNDIAAELNLTDSWNLSILSLKQMILKLPEEQQNIKLEHLSDMLSQNIHYTGVTNHSISYRIGYDMLVMVADKMAAISRDQRRQLGLPIKNFIVATQPVVEAPQLEAVVDAVMKEDLRLSELKSDKTKDRMTARRKRYKSKITKPIEQQHLQQQEPDLQNEQTQQLEAEYHDMFYASVRQLVEEMVFKFHHFAETQRKVIVQDEQTRPATSEQQSEQTDSTAAEQSNNAIATESEPTAKEDDVREATRRSKRKKLGLRKTPKKSA